MTAPSRKADPVVLLRQFLVGKKKVVFADDYLDFDGQKIHRSSRCGYRIAAGRPLVDIGSVWYMFREISGDRPYTQESTKKRGFQYIGVANRGDLCDYLVGRIDTCPGLDIKRKRPREELEGGAEAEAPTKVKAKDRRKAGEISYADFEARVRPVKDLDVLVRAPGKTIPNADLILRIAQDEVSNWYHREDRSLETEAPTGTPFVLELEHMLKEDPDKKPIILVPCNKNAPVNLLTVQKLLQEGQYYPSDEERLRYFESTRPEYVNIVRNVRGRLWTFEARDSTKGFSKGQWQRVVAVISDSSDWQFKGWPFETIVDLFTTMKGFYFCPRGELPPKHMNDWAVTILKMPPFEFQHHFAHISDQFWFEVEGFLGSKRLKKFVNHTTLETKRVVHKMPPIL